MIFFPAGPALVLGTVSCFPDLFLRLKRMQKVTLNVLDGIERNGSLETNFSLPASPRHNTELLPFTTTNATSAPCLFLYLRGRPCVCVVHSTSACAVLRYECLILTGTSPCGTSARAPAHQSRTRINTGGSLTSNRGTMNVSPYRCRTT
jgi:hypothetical protein